MRSVLEDFGLASGLGDNEAGKQGAVLERLAGHEPDNFGVVIVLAQMAEDERGGARIQLVAKKRADDLVRQMASAAHDALLDGPGIGADLEHFEVVVRFEDQHIRAAQMIFNRVGEITKIGHDADFDAARAEAEADRIARIVRDGKAVDLEIAHAEGRTGLKGFERRSVVVPVDRARRERGHVNRDAAVAMAREGAETAHMIGVFVADEDGVNRIERFTDGIEAGLGFALAQTGIDENARAAGGDESAISRTAAGQNTDFDDERPPRPELKQAG